MRSKKNNNKIELALSFTDYKGNSGLAIVELNATARNFRTHLTAHIVNSIYGKRNIENYIQKAENDGRLLTKKSEEFSQVKAQVQYKSVINENSSDNKTIPQKVQSVNSSISENGENDTGKFSLQENEETTLAHEELLKENEELKKANQILSEEFKLTNGHKMGTKAREELRRMSKKFLRQWKSTYNADEYTERVMSVFEYLSTDNPDTDKALNSLAAIGKDVITQTSIKEDYDPDFSEEYYELKRYLRNTPIYLSPEQKKSQIASNYGDLTHTVAELDDAINKVKSEYISPAGSLPITSNGSFDVKNFKTATVDVPVPDDYINIANVLNHCTKIAADKISWSSNKSIGEVSIDVGFKPKIFIRPTQAFPEAAKA